MSAIKERLVPEVVERALLAFSQDPNYFVSIVEQGRVNAERIEDSNASCDVTFVTSSR